MCGCCSGSPATPGHPHTELHRRLVDSSSIRAGSSSASRCRSRSHEGFGVKTKRKEKCASSSTEDHLSGRSVGLDHDAGSSVSCSYRVDPRNSQESERRPVTHCEAVSETVGSDGSCVQRDTFWPAVHETLAVVAQDHRVFPEGQPVSHDQGHAAMLTCLRHVEETVVPVTRPRVGGSVSSRNANDGRLPHGLGSGHEWPLRSRSVGRSPSQLAHQLPGDAGSFSSIEAFSSRPRRPSCASSHRQYVGGLLHQPPGGSAFAPPVQAGAPDPSVGPGETALLEGSVHPWVRQSGSRHPVETGAEARGMDAPHRGDGADLEEVRSSPGGLVCVSRDLTMSPLVLSDSSSSTGAGCHGADVAEASSVRLPPDCSAPGSSGESSPGRGSSLVSSPVLAGPSMVCGPGSPSRRLSMGDSRSAGSPLTGRGHHSSPPPRVVEAMGVALRVRESTIAAHHAPVGEQSLGRNPLVTRFLRGTRRLRPPVRPRMPTWDLAVVLEALSKAPFEPLEEVPWRFLTVKTVFLLAISSLKRVGDLQALSVAPSCLEFAPGMARAFLYPRPGYVPKVPSVVPRPVILQAFCPPPFRDSDQEKLNCVCPVRALDTYVHRAALWRKSDQLFVCYGPYKKGLPANKQTLSRWIVDAITTAYESSDLPSPLGVRAHSTRGMAASKAFSSGVSMHNICNAAGWSTPLTFVRFYSLDLDATPGSSVLSA